MNRVAAIQMASGPNVDANLNEVAKIIDDAVNVGAGLIVLPENFAFMGINESDIVKVAENSGAGKIQNFLADQAAKHNVWLVGGTLPLKTDSPDRVKAACLVFNEKGEQVARYDKIHLFDVELVDSNETYAESKTIEPGDEIVVIDSPFGQLGLAICYDIRFPEQFRAMLQKGVELFAIPSAFTAITGKAHWEILIRARAIENLSFVIAAAQGGYHVNGRETHGDSMIVDPWGSVLDRLPRGSGYVISDMDSERLKNIRRNFPAIEHRRF